MNTDHIAQQAGLDISSFDAKEILMGMKVEQEHNGQMGSDVDVAPGNDQGVVLKIVVAHMREDPKYYTKLKEMESESTNRIQKLIENKKVSISDFNLFIESLPKSSEERVARYSRLKKRYHIPDPGKKVDDKTDRIGNNDPTKTPRGKSSVRKQARDNQRHPDRFTEAIEFVERNNHKTLDECQSEIDGVKDKTALLALIMSLLNKSGVNINRDWLRGIKGAAEGQYG